MNKTTLFSDEQQQQQHSLEIARARLWIIYVCKNIFNARADAVCKHIANVIAYKQNRRLISQIRILIGLHLKY